MQRLNWTNKEHAREVFAFAKRTGRTADLKRNLRHLRQIAINRGSCARVDIYKDFAPMSFEWAIGVPAEGGARQCVFNGGLIYHGAHDGGGNGSAPTFSVCLNPTDGWSIHT